MKRFFAVVAWMLLLPLTAHAWWNEDWTVRKMITLDTVAAGISAELTAVPVLLRLSTGNFDFLAATDKGADLRFVAEDDKTPLPFFIERYDAGNELAFVWVQVPKVAGGNSKQHIWLYYGNANAPTAPVSPVYDAQQWAVYHLSDASGLPQDATAAGNHVSQGKVTPVPTGLIAGSVKLAGDGGLVAGNAGLQAATAFTFSAWIKPETGNGELLAVGDLSLTLAEGVPVLAAKGASARGTAPLALNAWQHVAMVAGAGADATVVMYVNGKPVGSLPGAFAPAASVRIGGGLVGELDEVQLSTVGRSAAWIALQADSQGAASKLVKQGEEQATASKQTGYFMATMNNLTVDGWVVVGVCVVMFFVALFVMGSKAKLLARQEKVNPRFTEAFDQLTKSLPALGNVASDHAKHLDQLSNQEKEYSDSPLHRIFQVGARELKFRFANTSSTAPGPHTSHELPAISERAMLAVRSSLDAQLTRERQRLDKGMVLLTIAISGGPFLGLLGTVVGVMITFAAIAAAGDVNVNAIAPGIAAALVATVAGLGVAIPSLFGYNYLQTRIKMISADMNVFVDEFVTKMSETYGD
jgi:biopolymer transport protein ExbB